MALRKFEKELHRNKGQSLPALFESFSHLKNFKKQGDEVSYRKTQKRGKDGFYGEAFSLEASFNKFVKLAEQIGVEAAWQAIRPLVEMDMRSYVQEESRAANMYQFATQVSFQFSPGGRRFPIFRNAQYQDVRKQEPWQIFELSQDAHGRFFQELGQYYRVWLSLVRQIPQCLSENSNILLKQLKVAGFRKVENFSIQVSLQGLANFSDKTKTTAWIGPQKIVYASPSSRFHLDGKSTILRHAQLVYIPDLNEYFILDQGYFSGHSNQEISQYLQVAGSQEKLPQSEKEFFYFQAFLAEEDWGKAPEDLFQQLRQKFKISAAKPLPLGENVRDATYNRDYSSQLKFIQRLFFLEFETCSSDPSRKNTVAKALSEPAKAIQHSLARATSFNNIDSLIDSYQTHLMSLDASLTSKQVQDFYAQLLKIHPDFLIDMTSWVDCGTGTVLNLNTFSTKLSQGSFRVVKTRAQLTQGCEKRGISKALFTENLKKRKCPSCQKITHFMGPCICPECHFNISDHEMTNLSPKRSSQLQIKSSESTVINTSEKVSISNFIAGFFANAA